MKRPPNYSKRFQAIRRAVERARRMDAHSRSASDFYAHDQFEKADKELRKAEKLLRK